MFYEQLLIEQQKTAWFMDGSAKMNGQHPIWNAATLRPVHGKTIIEESKHKSTQWAGLHAVS